MRRVRVSSVSFYERFTGTFEEIFRKNIQHVLSLTEYAMLDRPDLVVLTETFPYVGLPIKERMKFAETSDGKTIRMFCKLASKYKTYIMVPILEIEGNCIYNSAVLIDRKGKVQGSYHKVHPTISESEAGICAGDIPVLFETDFGKLGVAICFDINFDDLFQAYRGKAKIVAFPSAFDGGFLIQSRAYWGRHFMVSAVRSGYGKIVDPLGRVISKSSTYNPVITKDINLDYEVLHIDYTYQKWKAIKRKYNGSIEIDVVRPEAVYMLVSNSNKVTVPDIMKEFGLENRDEYFRRSDKYRKMG